MPSFVLTGPHGEQIQIDGPMPTESERQEIVGNYENAQARAANAGNIAAAKAIPNAPDSESAAGYVGGLQQGMQEAGQDIVHGAPLLGKNIVSSAKALPGKLLAGAGQLGDAIVGTAINRPAPVGAPRIGMSGAQANQIALAAPNVAAKSVKEAATGGRSLPDQYLQSAATDPAGTALATAGAFTGVGDALGLAGGVAEGAGASSLADGLAANAASAKFFGDPLNVAGAIGKVTAKVQQGVASAKLKPADGDFVQSGSDPNVYGRVVGQTGSGLNRGYTVQTPNGEASVAWHDVLRHAPAADIDSVVAANPGAERIFGTAGADGYQFTPDHQWSAEETPNPEPQQGPITPEAPNAPSSILQGNAAAERYAPTGAALPGRSQGALQDNSLYTDGGQSGRFIPSAIRPTPTGPTSTSTPRTQGLLENRTLVTGNGDSLNPDRGQGGQIILNGQPATAPPVAPAPVASQRLLTAPAPVDVSPTRWKSAIIDAKTAIEDIENEAVPKNFTGPTNDQQDRIGAAIEAAAKTHGVPAGILRKTVYSEPVVSPDTPPTPSPLYQELAASGSGLTASAPVTGQVNGQATSAAGPSSNGPQGALPSGGQGNAGAPGAQPDNGPQSPVPSGAAAGAAPRVPLTKPEASELNALMQIHSFDRTPAQNARVQALHPATSNRDWPGVSSTAVINTGLRYSVKPDVSNMGVTSPLHTETPAGAPPADIMPAKAAIVKAKAEKIDPRTGMTSTQSTFLVDALAKALPSLPETAATAYTGAGSAKTMDSPGNVTIQIPDDGRFTIGGKDQAVALINKMGKPSPVQSPSYGRSQTGPTYKESMPAEAAINEAEVARAKANKKSGVSESAPGYTFKKTERGFIMVPDVSGVEDAAAQLRNFTSGNLNMMERHTSPETVNAAREIEGANGKTAAIMHGPMQQAAILLRHVGGAEVLPEMLTSSRLRGVADRWHALAGDAQTKPVYHNPPGGAAVLDPTFESHLKTLEAAAPHRFRTSPSVKISQKAKDLAEQAGKTGNDKPLRDLLRKTFTQAGDVATASARSIVPDAKFNALSNDPRYLKAEGLYKAHVEPVLTASHASNDGAFSSALGPRGTYYPLQPTDANGEAVHGRVGAGRPEFTTPTNRSNQFATGQSADYDTSMAAFRKFTEGSLRRNSQAALMKQMTKEGILQPEANAVPETDHNGQPTGLKHITLPNGSVHVAQSVPVNMQGDRMIAPAPIVHELGPILHKTLPGWGGAANFGPLTGVANFVNAIGLAGPTTMLIHTENIISVVAHELAASAGVPGAALNAIPLAQRIHAAAKMLRVDPSSPASLARISEMAKAAVVPSEYGAATFSKQEAEDTGAHLAYPEGGKLFTRTSTGRMQTHPVSITPLLFGRNGLDIRARLVLWDIARDAAGIKPADSMIGPNGQWKNPAQALRAAKTVERVGRYVSGLESSFVRFMKQSGAGPTATAATTMASNAARYWLHPSAFIRGAGLAVASWVIAHKAITGKYPWEDHNSRFGYIPFHHQGKTYYGDYLSTVNTLYARGARITGVASAYNARVKGAKPGQVLDAAATGPINAGLHLAFGGPAASTIFRGATLQQPYVTHVVSKSGKPSLGMIPAVRNVGNGVGARLGAHGLAAAESLSPMVSMAEQGAGVGSEGQGTANMPPQMRAASMLSQYLGSPIRTKQSTR
jgi:hypothetical protein